MIYNGKNIEMIAGVKTRQSIYTWLELFITADYIGDVIAVYTDKEFNGSYDLIARARRLTDKPILAKGIHATDENVKKAIDAGANYVLVVGRIPEVYQEKCWIEPYTLEELARIPEEFKVVWNSRDLRTGGLKEETFEQARQIRKGWLCQASNIGTMKDVHPEADGILVGTHLVEFERSLR